MVSLLVVSVCLVMVGCFLLVAGHVPPGVAWTLIVAGVVGYAGVRVPRRWRERRVEDAEDAAEERDR